MGWVDRLVATVRKLTGMTPEQLVPQNKPVSTPTPAGERTVLPSKPLIDDRLMRLLISPAKAWEYVADRDPDCMRYLQNCIKLMETDVEYQALLARVMILAIIAGEEVGPAWKDRLADHQLHALAACYLRRMTVEDGFKEISDVLRALILRRVQVTTAVM